MSTSRYVISFENFEMTLSLTKIDKLHPHEELQPRLLNQLIKDIKSDQILKHPVIVDRDSLTILDGNHRTEALKELGCNLIPVCMVDYQASGIRVECWYRSISNSIENGGEDSRLLERFWDFSKSKVGVTENILNLQRNIALLTRGKIFLMDSSFSSLEEVYYHLTKIEFQARALGLEVYYDVEDDARRKLRAHEAIAVIATPPLNKDLVLKKALNGERFPCKTTRHILPGRPMGINCPLDFLNNHSLNEANEMFLDALNRKQLRCLPPGSTMNGRRYDEPLFLFE